MGIKQQVIFICDYCKACETHAQPLEDQKTKHWVAVKMNQIVDGKEAPVNLTFDSAKCAAQALKKISEGKAVILKDSKPPVPAEPPSKVREIVKFDESGNATSDTDDPPQSAEPEHASAQGS